jgi:hypothetical protein
MHKALILYFLQLNSWYVFLKAYFLLEPQLTKEGDDKRLKKIFKVKCYKKKYVSKGKTIIKLVKFRKLFSSSDS